MQLMAEVDQFVGQTSKTLAAQRDHYQPTQTQLASCLEFVEESQRTGSPQGVHLKSMSGLKGPRRLAVTEEELIAVAEYVANCISVFNLDDHKMRSFGHLGYGQSKLSDPRGVALCSDNSVLVTADHCVKKYSLDGKFMTSVGTKGSGQLEFSTPWGIATDNNKVYVCDAANY